jgi:hypothetical protein
MSKLNLDVVGYSGLKEWGGTINEEFNRRLKGPFAQKVYKEMADNSSTIGAIRYLIRALTRAVDWRIESKVEEQKAQDVAEFVESCLLDLDTTFDDFISEALSFLDYGWAYFEILYKLRKGESKDLKTKSKFNDGKIGWRKFALRAQDTLDRWEFDTEDGSLKGLHQLTKKGQAAFIPIDKAILFRTETYKDNPEGRSIYRNAVVDYYYLKRISEIEAIGIERDFAGLPVMEVPLSILHPDAPAKEKALRASIEKMLSEIKRDEREYALVPAEAAPDGTPTGYKFKLLTSGGSRQIDTDKTKVYYKTSILQSVVAQFLQLGTSNVGSFALASSQTNLFAVALGAYLDMMSQIFNRMVIGPLMELNNIDTELWPELVHGDIESPPLAEIGAYIQALSMSGANVADEAVQNKLFEIANLPIPEKAADVPAPPVEKSKRRAPLRALQGSIK